MKIRDAMVTQVERIGAGRTVLAAAQLMLEQDVGFVPVAEQDRLVGVITDRDIVLRVVAAGLDPAGTLVEAAMTPGAKYCYDDEEVGHIVANMAGNAVRRLPVMNRRKRLIGVVSMDDLRPWRMAPEPAATTVTTNRGALP